MIQLNLSEAKTRLSELVEELESGREEVVVISRRNVPVAEIRPVRRRLVKPRPLAPRPGFTVPDSAFDPLPDDLLDAFEGRG